MIKIDLHVHSKFSGHASEWFLKKIGANESYIEPEAVYRLAIANGMKFVTLTDHNEIQGSLELIEKQKQIEEKIIKLSAVIKSADMRKLRHALK